MSLSAIRAEARPLVITGARIVDPTSGLDAIGSVVVVDGLIRDVARGAAPGVPEGATIIEARGKALLPGLIDMRVFVGEPGAEHRETFASAGQAAAAGGVTTIVTMPDTDPVIDDVALVDFIARLARDTAAVNVLPMAALTKGLKGREMTEFGLLGAAGAVGFTDGRHSITNALVLRRALTYARDFGALIMHHPADPDLVGSGVMNEGETATRLGLPGIPREAEIIMLERDIRIAALTGGRYHAAQISCAASLDIIRRAKKQGLAVSCGVSATHLALNERDVGPYRTFYRLAPPLRDEDDRLAMIEGVADGSIDVIVSSHDPQDVDTKRHPFAEAGRRRPRDAARGRAASGPQWRGEPRLGGQGAFGAAGRTARAALRPDRGRSAGRSHPRRSGATLDLRSGQAAFAVQEHALRGRALRGPRSHDPCRRPDGV